MLYNRIFLLLLTVLFILTGCNSPVYNQTEANVADVKQRVNESVQRSNESGKIPPALVVNQGLYVDRTPISLSKEPSWLKNSMVIRGEELPFSYYSRTIVGGGGKNVLTRYQVGLDESLKVSMNYSGTVKGALDLLAAKSGYVYTVNGNSVYWQAFITKTFDVAFMPGSSDYMMGKSSSGGSLSASGGSVTGGSAGSASTAVSAILDDSAASQYSSLSGKLSIWKDLEATIKQLLSANGTVMVSESTTSVTVRDRPTNVELVSKYVSNLNNRLSQQVLVKVQVLDVRLSNGFNYGIDWNLMKRTLDGTNFFLNVNYGTPVSITPLTGADTTQQFGITQMGVTAFNALVNTLNQQGKTSIVTEPRVVCLNNQVSVVRIVEQTGYLASVQTTSLAGSTTAGGASVTSQITPGTVITGLTLYILPKILGNKVYLQVNADLSINNGIKTISSATGTTPSSTSTTPGSIIQVPDVTQKQFNQRSVINSGDTLILSGFRQLSNQTGAMQLLNSQALGGKAAQEISNETIVLITPIILHGIA
jgi:type IVB pilus formation R64 PilN family outer membrane protein